MEYENMKLIPQTIKCSRRKMWFSWLSFAICFTLLQSQLSEALSQSNLSVAEVNLSDWRQHRRQKRFIIFENSGISKLVCGITFPVDLGDKVQWRQLVMTMNLQFQFPVPQRPIYWWDRWSDRSLAPHAASPASHQPPVPPTDEAQLFLYQFAERLMQRRQTNGRACLQRAICENAQVHRHSGLYAELLHRLLIPHRTLDAHYLDAYQLGRHGVACRTAYPQATHCLFDPYLVVREEYLEQTFLK